MQPKCSSFNARMYFKRTKFAAMFCMKLLNNFSNRNYNTKTPILQIKVVPMQQVNISKKVRVVMIEFCYFSFTSIFLGFSFSSASFFCLLTSTSCKEIHERNPAFYQFLTFFLLLHNSANFYTSVTVRQISKYFSQTRFSLTLKRIW